MPILCGLSGCNPLRSEGSCRTKGGLGPYNRTPPPSFCTRSAHKAGILTRERIFFRQKPKLALSINGEIASKMVKSRRPEDLAKFTRPHDSRAHTAERHTTKKGKKEKGEVFSVKPVETEHAERSHRLPRLAFVVWSLMVAE